MKLRGVIKKCDLHFIFVGIFLIGILSEEHCSEIETDHNSIRSRYEKKLGY